MQTLEEQKRIVEQANIAGKKASEITGNPFTPGTVETYFPNQQKQEANKLTGATGFGSGITADEIRKSQFEATQQTTDPNVLREQALDRYQGEIDSTTEYYDKLIAEARQEGEQTLVEESGKSRSLRASQGILGTARGQARGQAVEEKVKSETERQVALLEAEKQAQISGFLGEARDYEIERQLAEQEAKKAGADEFLNYLDTVSAQNKERANTIITAMIAQGIGYDEINIQDIKQLSSMLGISEGEIRTIYKGLEAQNQPEEVDPFEKASTSLRDFEILKRTGEIAPETTYNEYLRQVALAKKVTTTKEEDTDTPLSVWEIGQMQQMYPGIEINPGDTLNDIREKQVAKFIEDNPEIGEEDEEVIAQELETQTELEKEAVIGIIEKIRRAIAVPVYKALGGKVKKEAKEDKEEEEKEEDDFTKFLKS